MIQVKIQYNGRSHDLGTADGYHYEKPILRLVKFYKEKDSDGVERNIGSRDIKTVIVAKDATIIIENIEEKKCNHDCNSCDAE